MTQERSERVQKLIDFTKEEIEKAKSQKTSNLTSYKQLMEMFGYKNIGYVYSILQGMGLTDERRIVTGELKIAAKELTRTQLIPSRELAWLLGILATRGILSSSGQTSFGSSKKTLITAFKENVERTFDLNVEIQETEKVPGKSYYTANFNRVDITRELGDLRRLQWPQTILDKYNWVIDKSDYLWGFLEGMFETRCTIGLSNRLVFNERYQNCANFTMWLLIKAGILNPYLAIKSKNSGQIQGTTVSNLRDINLLAQNIHSKIPWKEERLQYYRDLQINWSNYPHIPLEKKPEWLSTNIASTERHPIQKHGLSKPERQNQIITEWKRLVLMLGHSPTSHEIRVLRKGGLTEYTSGTYTNNFGQLSDGTCKFSIAKIFLDSL